jgi:PKD repeat protein
LVPTTFTGGFTDPGWVDTHTATWDFGDGTVQTGAVTEEHNQPDATGVSVIEHVYSQPGTYTITLTVQDKDGGIGQATVTVTVLSAENVVDLLDGYIQGLSADSFNGPAPQHKNTLHNKLQAVKTQIGSGAIGASIHKLQNDVRAKADGSRGGNSKDDWIIGGEAQMRICSIVDDLVAYLLVSTG